MSFSLAKGFSVGALLLLGVTTMGACGGQTVVDGSGGGTASDGGCVTDKDCPSNKLCGYPASDGCAAKGVCVTPMTGCADGCFNATLACDGTCICFDCSLLPGDYLPQPFPPNPASCDTNVVMN